MTIERAVVRPCSRCPGTAVKRARSAWTVRPHGARQTVLASDAEVELRGGLLGLPLEPLMGRLSRRLGVRSLAAFKYLAEHGAPYGGRHADLPRPNRLLAAATTRPAPLPALQASWHRSERMSVSEATLVAALDRAFTDRWVGLGGATRCGA